jgi:hypothetical protein
VVGSRGKPVDGKGMIKYLPQPSVIGEVPELGLVNQRLQGTPKKTPEAAA